MRFCAILALLCALPLEATELFSHLSFNPPPSLALQGSAAFAGNRVQLTPFPGSRGGVWFPTKRFLQYGFDTTFQFRMGSSPEGVAFVIQNNVLPGLGRGAGGLGYEGLVSSIAVEFDARQNPEFSDLSGAHVSIQSRGATTNSPIASASLASAAASALTDGNIHTARVRYVPGTLEVFLDDTNTALVTAAVTVTNLFPLDNGQAWFGIVAANSATGGLHEILTWSFSLIDAPMSVALISPLEGASFLIPAVIDLEATVAGPDPISRVEFYQGTQRLVTISNAPFRFRWDGMLPGPYTLLAVGIDTVGRRVASQPVPVLVYPAEPAVGINFVSAPTGSNYVLEPREKAGVIPQYYWNNGTVLSDGTGQMINLRNAAGEITAIDAQYDFAGRGEETNVMADLSPDHRLMRAYAASFTGPQPFSLMQLRSIPYSIYDLIICTDGANAGANRVGEFRAQGAPASVFVRDAAWTSFAGLYAGGGGATDAGANTPAGNYVRINGLTASSLFISNFVRFASDGAPLSAINAVQIVPSVYDRNSPIFVSRGPYLQMANETSILIRWRSNRPATSRVRYGTNPNNLDLTVQDSTERQEHALTLTNLLPNTRYYYAVGTTQSNLVQNPNLFFWTAPAAPKPTRVWVIGDSGTANANAAAVRDAFNSFSDGRYVDVWLMLGDNAYNSGTDAEYQAAVFNMYTNLLPQTPLWPTIGNHETAQSHAQVPTTPYLSIFTLPQNGEIGGVPSGTERYYSFNYGDIHFVCLDSMTNDRSSNGPMANWLRADLLANTKHWTIVFFHHPPYTKGSHDSDDPNGADFELVEMRENINPILESFGVDLVFSGHSHCYERSFLVKGHYGYSTNLEPSMILDNQSGNPDDPHEMPYSKVSDGTVYIVDGSSGQATFGTMDHPIHYQSILNLGSVVLDIEGGQLTARFLRETGVVQDKFVIVKEVDDSQARPRLLSIRSRDGVVGLNWSAQPGARYVVERAVELDSGIWQPISEPLTAESTTHSWSCPWDSTASALIFRVTKLD